MCRSDPLDERREIAEHLMAASPSRRYSNLTAAKALGTENPGDLKFGCKSCFRQAGQGVHVNPELAVHEIDEFPGVFQDIHRECTGRLAACP